jgi:hypothetical protein
MEIVTHLYLQMQGLCQCRKSPKTSFFTNQLPSNILPLKYAAKPSTKPPTLPTNFPGASPQNPPNRPAIPLMLSRANF